MVGESQEQLVGAGAGGATGSNKTPTLEEYGTNLTTQANEVCHSSSLFTAMTCYATTWHPVMLITHDKSLVLLLCIQMMMPAAELSKSFFSEIEGRLFNSNGVRLAMGQLSRQ